MNKVTGFIFKPSRVKNGRKVRDAHFVLRLKVDGKKVGKDVRLKVRDHQVAEKRKVESIREKERELAGIFGAEAVAGKRRKNRCQNIWLTFWRIYARGIKTTITLTSWKHIC